MCIRRKFQHIQLADTSADTTSSVLRGTSMHQSSNSPTTIDMRETRNDVQSVRHDFIKSQSTLTLTSNSDEVRTQKRQEVILVILVLLVVGLSLPFVSPPHLFCSRVCRLKKKFTVPGEPSRKNFRVRCRWMRVCLCRNSNG